MPPEQWRDSADYLFGCDLYNHAYWWEAHEAWEALWQACDKRSTQGRFLQGMIQAAACHLKLHMASPSGVERLRESSVEYLRGAAADIDGEAYMGLDVRAFQLALEAYWNACIGQGGNIIAHDAGRYPFILLDL